MIRKRQEINSSSKNTAKSNGDCLRSGIFSKYSNIVLVLKNYAPQLLHSPKALIVILVLSGLTLVASLIPLAFPFFSRFVIDEVIPNKSIRLFGYLAVLAAVLYLLRVLINFALSYLNVMAAVYTQKVIRKELFDRLMNLPMSIQRSREYGNITRRLINDVDVYTVAILEAIPTSIGQISMFVALCIIIGALNKILLLLMAISIPAIFFINILSSCKLRTLFSKKGNLRDRQVNIINIAVQGFISLISFGVTNSIKEIFAQTIKEDVTLERRKWFIFASKQQLEWVFSTGIGAVAMWTAYYLVMTTSLTLGEAVAAIMYFGLFLIPVIKIAGIAQSMAAASTAAGRLLQQIEFISSKHVDNSVKTKVSYESLNGCEIKLDNVSFSYLGSSCKAIKNISVEIPKHRIIGVSGSSGAGKTTLAKIFAGHFTPSEGTVTYSSELLPQNNPKGTRPHILYLPDEIFLLPGSIRENIEFFSKSRELTKMQKCLIDTCMDKIVYGLPEGLNIKLGKDGLDLSKGQKQRIMVARAFYSLPRVAIFDEATNYIDTDTEKEILSNIRKLVDEKGMTFILVSHKKQVMDYCDVIIYLSPDGRILDNSEKFVVAREDA